MELLLREMGRRVCIEAGCETVLSDYNGDVRCRHHSRTFFVRGSLLKSAIPSWAYQGACVPHDPESWFPETDGSEAAEVPEIAKWALSICGFCPVRRPCLEYAFAIEGTYRNGIYGGVTAAERETAAHRPDRIEHLLLKAEERYLSELQRPDGKDYVLEGKETA